MTVWAPEALSPEASKGGQILQRQLEEFSQSAPGVRVNYVLKNPYAQGGLVDFLLQVQALVPSRLPDVVVIDSTQLDTVDKAQLLQPLDRDLPAGAMADLFSPAQKLARVDGRWVALPITVDVQHLAFNKEIVAKPPTTWENTISSGGSFAFPAVGDDAFLFQYLENGGRFTTGRQPGALDASVISSVLTYFEQARAAKLVPDSTLGIKTTHDVWPLFASGQVALAQVEASDFWSGMDRLPNAGYAALPTRDGREASFVATWNLAIVTSDPVRHAAAAKLLNWLNEPSRLSEWATAARVIPARRSAFVNAVTPTDYADFLRRLIEAGIVAPSLAERAPYSTGWRTALQAVLRGQSTPAEAASKAAQPAIQ
ncbi:MAG: extracellular solute-binding protein [Rudaea sp.]